MIYAAFDGTLFEARTFDGIVERMAEEKLRIPRSLNSYRQSVADRVQDAYNVTIDWTSSRPFLRDLEKAGLVKRIK